MARAKKTILRLREVKDGKRLVKDGFLASAEISFADFDYKDVILKQIKGLQLSDSTITRWIEDIGKGHM